MKFKVLLLLATITSFAVSAPIDFTINKEQNDVIQPVSIEEPEFDDNLNILEPENKIEQFDDETENESQLQTEGRRLLAANKAKVFPVKMTVDNEFDLYINGKKVGSGNSWTTTYSFNPSFTKVTTIAIDGRDKGGPAALIGVFNGKPTKAADWKCQSFGKSLPANWMKPSFDDSKWPRAVSFGRNNQNNVWYSVGRGKRPNIPNEAEWLWTRDNNNHDRVVCRMSLITEKQKQQLLVRSGYTKIKSYLNTIQAELNKDMKATKTIDSKSRATLDGYNNNILSLQKSLISTQKALNDANKFNSKYVQQLNAENAQQKSLLASLQRQRNYIAVEHTYINKMENEALGLKKTTPQYKAIQVEIQQMRNQMKKEILDVEKAYAQLLALSTKKRNTLSKQRTTTQARIRSLTTLLSQYNVKHKQFEKMVADFHKKIGVSGFTIKALNQLSKATVEFQSHVNDMSKTNMMLNFNAGYSQCVNEYNKIKQFYSRAKCTK